MRSDGPPIAPPAGALAVPDMAAFGLFCKRLTDALPIKTVSLRSLMKRIRFSTVCPVDARNR